MRLPRTSSPPAKRQAVRPQRILNYLRNPLPSPARNALMVAPDGRSGSMFWTRAFGRPLSNKAIRAKAVCRAPGAWLLR
jgi:hypothetical protein